MFIYWSMVYWSLYSKPLYIGGEINITLVINQSVKYKKTIQYSIQPRDRIFVNGYGFLFFPKKMDKNISENLSDKYGQKLLDHAKQSAENLFKKSHSKNSRTTGDLIGNKISNRITKVSKNSQQNNLETDTNELYQ